MPYAMVMILGYPLGQASGVLINWLMESDSEVENPYMAHDHAIVFIHTLNLAIVGLSIVFVTQQTLRSSFESKEKVEIANERMKQECGRSEVILKNILPYIYVPTAQKKIRNRLKGKEDSSQIFQKSYADCAVLFSDLVSFTDYSSSISATKLVEVLNILFREFDRICLQHKVEKIKTVGDAYFAVSGIHGTRLEDNVQRCTLMALDMIDTLKQLNEVYNWNLHIRIGVGVGNCTLAVFGVDNITFDAYGPAVEEAMAMEESSSSDRVKFSAVAESIISKLHPDGIQHEFQNNKETEGYLVNPSLIHHVHSKDQLPEDFSERTNSSLATNFEVRFPRLKYMFMFRGLSRNWETAKYVCVLSQSVETSFIVHFGFTFFHVLRVFIQPRIQLWGDSSNLIHSVLFYVIILVTLVNLSIFAAARWMFVRYQKKHPDNTNIQTLYSAEARRFTKIALSTYTMNVLLAIMIPLSMAFHPGYISTDLTPSWFDVMFAVVFFPSLSPIFSPWISLGLNYGVTFLGAALQGSDRIDPILPISLLSYTVPFTLRQMAYTYTLMGSLESDHSYELRREQIEKESKTNNILLHLTLPPFIVDKLKKSDMEFQDSSTTETGDRKSVV